VPVGVELPYAYVSVGSRRCLFVTRRSHARANGTCPGGA
jgi:hypothetical protein